MSRPRRTAYFTGLGLHAAAAGGALLLLPRLAAGSTAPEPLRGLGSLFTGLTLLSGFAVWRRLRRLIPPPRPMDGRMLAWSLLLLLPIACGVALWQNGGRHALTARHARVFILLPPVMFFALVPRPRASERS